MNRDLESLRNKANNLPMLPGVYLMKNSEGQILYIGKAKLLRNRVSTYFHGEHTLKVSAMIDKVADFEIIVADSEFEALVLENSLIKLHKPHYNILLKDDKAYPFIKINLSKAYPDITLASKAEKDNSSYYGPFGSRKKSIEIIRALKQSFSLPDCSLKFPRDIGKVRPCLNYHIGKCSGWCLPETESSEYRVRISQVQMVLEGKTAALVEALKREMNDSAAALQFEKAAELRDRLTAIEALKHTQGVVLAASCDTDAIGIYRGEKTCFSVLHFVDGNLVGKNFFFVEDIYEDDSQALEAFLCAFYSGPSPTRPHEILLPCNIPDSSAVEELLNKLFSHRVKLIYPQRGSKVLFVDKARINAAEEVARHLSESEKRQSNLENLKKILGLTDNPCRIEAFDVSNLGNSGIVAVMTVFESGKPCKRDYRRFRLSELSAQDDYSAIYNAIYRRYKRFKNAENGFEKFPDLLLIDGGEVHARTANDALRDLNLVLPVFGMVKDKKHKTRALVSINGEEIGITGNIGVFSFIGTIQEETHRFAISYQRSLRNEGIGVSLEKIPGIGEKRRIQLLKHFKTIKAISEADIEKLSEIAPVKLARVIYDYYHSNGEAE